MNFKLLSAAIVGGLLFAISATAPAFAHENAFQKAGKAIQYTTRKDAENISETTHRAEHKNSVHKVRNHHYKYILTPAGDHVWVKPKYHHTRH